MNLLATATHEIGHSLGLEHSNTYGSIMWPWTRHSNAASQQVKLARDDIIAIQALYGDKRRSMYF